MKLLIPTTLLLASLTVILPTIVLAVETPAAAAQEHADQSNVANNDFSYVRYRADYQVNADATSSRTENYDVLLNTKAAVEKFSQIRLSYNEKMETLEVIAAYTLTADGRRHDVTPDHIFTQESYSSANAPLYADSKVRVIVFPSLEPGSHVVYQVRTTQKKPYFPGYFSLWETFSVFDQVDDAEVNLQASAKLPMHIFIRGVEGGNKPQIRDGQAHWRWHYSRSVPMKEQNLTAHSWTFSPTIMASTYREWAQVAKAYQLKAGAAAKVTPAIQALADKITAGISDRREQAEALYRWVAQNIRYVAVYLGNGGLEPHSSQSILDNHYGDCKDHVVILEALLSAKGIESSPVLIGMDEGPILPKVPLIDRFNHVITYVPEFNLYMDSTNPWARFGQLPESDLNAPVLLTRDAKLARTPGKDEQSVKSELSVDLVFDKAGNMRGQTERRLSEVEEIDRRGYFSGLNRQNRAYIEASIMSDSGIDGRAKVVINSDPLDLKKQFDYSILFKADNYVDFGGVGGMTLPAPPGGGSFRTLYTLTAAPSNETPFYCLSVRYDEIYRLQLPDNVPIIAIPKDKHFSNSAGDYQVEWRRDGQRVTANHRLQLKAIHGKGELCQAQDYPAFRELYQQVRRGFAGQVVYGELANGK